MEMPYLEPLLALFIIHLDQLLSREKQFHLTNVRFSLVETAFILYRQHYQAQVAAQHPGLANPEISKLIGEQWREQSEEVKNSWKRLAEEEKVRHQRQYPDYRYQPRRGGKNAANHKFGIGAGSASGEDPGRCQKCGGRFIATPRTPTTPFTAATPGFAKTPTAAAPAYMASNPNSRAMEADHLRRGSTSSMVSVDGHGRRSTQPYLRDIDEDYPMMSPTGPPVPKRQRFHGSNGYMPTSPQPGAYMAHPEEPRAYPTSLMPNNTPISASGFGPGSLPRLSMSQVHLQQQQQQQAAYHQPNSISGMQPPPRPSVSYQGASQTPVTRAGSSFDESLRLPPLQTRLPKSPPMNSTVGSTASAATNIAVPNALGIVNPAGPPVQQRQSPAPQRLQFLYKLEVLRAISPPLKPPGPDTPEFETRGPIIAIEGLSPRVLKDITAVVEKALSISGECAVKTWADHEPVKEIMGCEKSLSDPKALADAKARDEGNKPASSIAKYLARMLKWHHTSEELTEYVTHHPPSSDLVLHSSASSHDRSTATEAMDVPSPRADPGTGATLMRNNPPRLPVAVVTTGYSLTVTERYAAALPIADTYRAEDHWRWVATLWRGVVGADLTVYVRACGDDELRAASCVDFASPSVLVIRVPEGGGGGGGGGSGVVDEKLERRLGFEIMEWVRSGQFGRRLG
jgi:HMG box factor, other